MLYLTHSLVDMSQAEKPVLSFPPAMQKAIAIMKEEANLDQLSSAYMFTPQDIGKKGSPREMTNNGVFSTCDPKDARTEYGKKDFEHFIQAAVKFLKEWKET